MDHATDIMEEETSTHDQIHDIEPQMDLDQSAALLDEFTCFSKLPKELRLQIWKFAIEESRVISYTIVQNGGKVKLYLEDSLPPGVLQVNLESRTEAQKVMEWNFDACRTYPLNCPKFFRNEIDKVYIDYHCTAPLGPDSMIDTLGSRASLAEMRYDRLGPVKGDSLIQKALNHKLRVFENIQTMIISRELWEGFRDQDLTIYLVQWFKFTSLTVLIKDRTHMYLDLGASDCWLKRKMADWEDYADWGDYDEFSEVVYNKSYAKYILGDFKAKHATYIKGPSAWRGMGYRKFDRRPRTLWCNENRWAQRDGSAVMEVKVLSE